jgi:hypothetical protein
MKGKHEKRNSTHSISADQSEQINTAVEDLFNVYIGIPSPLLSISEAYFKRYLKFTSIRQFFVLKQNNTRIYVQGA